jgi:hypothetical protein
MSIRNALVIMLVTSSGCASFLSFVGGVNVKDAEPEKARNPLGGDAVRYRIAARDSILQQVNNPDCTTWPLHDQYKLTASSDQICVESAVKYSVGPTHVGYRDAPHWNLVGDDGKQSALQLEQAGEPHRIGYCTRDTTTYEVWEQDVSGCAPNAGTLTEKSRQLAIRIATIGVKYSVAAWTFD